MALSIPANLNLLGYELAEKFAASAEYCEPLEMNSESRVETAMTPHALAILPTNTVVQVSEELQFCLVYPFIRCRASPAAVQNEAFSHSYPLAASFVGCWVPAFVCAMAT